MIHNIYSEECMKLLKDYRYIIPNALSDRGNTIKLIKKKIYIEGSN